MLMTFKSLFGMEIFIFSELFAHYIFVYLFLFQILYHNIHIHHQIRLVEAFHALHTLEHIHLWIILGYDIVSLTLPYIGG